MLVFIKLLLIVSALLFIAGSVSVAFVYESQTLWYKFGNDKIILWAGHVAGLLGAALIILQIMLGARGKFLEKYFAVAALMRLHRGNGIVIGCCVVLHVFLVLLPEGIANLPIGFKHWPEMVGSLLLWLILAMVIASHFRERLQLDYRRWRTVHKIMAYVAPILLFVHVYFVSDSFQQLTPRVALITTFSLLLLWILWNKKAN